MVIPTLGLGVQVMLWPGGLEMAHGLGLSILRPMGQGDGRLWGSGLRMRNTRRYLEAFGRLGSVGGFLRLAIPVIGPVPPCSSSSSGPWDRK